MVALLVKPLAAIAIVWLYYVFVYKGSHFLGRFIKNEKLYQFLFRERGDEDPRRGLPALRPGTNKGGLEKPPVLPRQE